MPRGPARPCAKPSSRAVNIETTKTARDCWPTFRMIVTSPLPDTRQHGPCAGSEAASPLSPASDPGKIGKRQEMHIAQNAEIGLVDQQVVVARASRRAHRMLELALRRYWTAGSISTSRSTQRSNPTKRAVTGGLGNQPRMKAKPVKKISCQPNGLKNHARSDHGSAGSQGQAPASSAQQQRVCANSQTHHEAATSRRLTRDSAIDDRHHRQDHHIHRQDVEIIRHIGQRHQAEQVCGARCRRRTGPQVELAHIVALERARDRSAQPSVAAMAKKQADMRPVDLPDAIGDARGPQRPARAVKRARQRRWPTPCRSRTRRSRSRRKIPSAPGSTTVRQLPGVWAIRMMNIAMPRKKSSRRSRTCAAALRAAARLPRAAAGIEWIGEIVPWPVRSFSAVICAGTRVMRGHAAVLAISVKAGCGRTGLRACAPGGAVVQACASAASSWPARRPASMVSRSNTSRWA